MEARERLEDVLRQANLVRQERIGVDERALRDARETAARLDVGEVGDVAFVLRVDRLEPALLGRALLEDAL